MNCHDNNMSAGSTLSRRSPLKRFFSPGGALASAHPAFESRAGQVEMAQEVEKRA